QRAFAGKLQALQQHPGFRPDLPTVLAAHVHIDGARLPNLFRMNEQHSIVVADSELPAEWAYVALGHIHQPQCVRGQAHVRYSGSIERLDLGERADEKGVVVVEVGPDGRRGEPACLPLPATPMYDVEIHEPRQEIPELRQRYPDADRALVRYRVRYTAGADNLEEILGELDRVLPRWYQREWHEAGALGPVLAGPEAVAPQQT